MTSMIGTTIGAMATDLKGHGLLALGTIALAQRQMQNKTLAVEAIELHVQAIDLSVIGSVGFIGRVETFEDRIDGPIAKVGAYMQRDEYTGVVMVNGAFDAKDAARTESILLHISDGLSRLGIKTAGGTNMTQTAMLGDEYRAIGFNRNINNRRTFGIKSLTGDEVQAFGFTKKHGGLIAAFTEQGNEHRVYTSSPENVARAFTTGVFPRTFWDRTEVKLGTKPTSISRTTISQNGTTERFVVNCEGHSIVLIECTMDDGDGVKNVRKMDTFTITGADDIQITGTTNNGAGIALYMRRGDDIHMGLGTAAQIALGTDLNPADVGQIHQQLVYAPQVA